MTAPPGHERRYEPSVDDADPAWDEFVESHPTAHFEQTAVWGNIQGLRGWTASRLKVLEAGKIVAGAQVLERPVGRFGRIGYVFRGPLYASSDRSNLGPSLNALVAHARRRGLYYLAVVPPYFSEQDRPVYERHGFFHGPPELPPSSSMLATAFLDLSRSDEELVRDMPRMTRRNVRYGQERGLEAVDGSRADIPDFSRLVVELCRRRGTTLNIPTGPFLEALWDRLAPRGIARLIMIRHEGTSIAGLMVFRYGAWCRAWRAGWSGEQAEKRPTELMYWKALQWARTVGCRHYDFGGIDSDIARELADGRERDLEAIRQRCSVTSYKLGFGGAIVPPVERFCLFPGRLTGPLLRRAVPWLLGSKRFRMLLNRRAAA